MAPKNKINLKDRCENGELDLSMSDLQEVPVKEIATIRKATSLDLSNNRLTTLGKNFITLTHVIKLDLSKNLLHELPEDFGEMKQLKHLDLYSNQITHLPLSFCELKNLRWLDLKNNPLVPAVARIVGQCLDAQQCQQSARATVAFMTEMKAHVEEERERLRQQELRELEAQQDKERQQKKKNERKRAARAKKKELNKKETEQEVKEDVTETPSEENSTWKGDNGKKKAKPIARKCSGCSFMLFLFISMPSIMFLLFLISASGILGSTADLWREYLSQHSQQMLEYVPEPGRQWGIIFTNWLSELHTATGHILDHFSNTVAEICQKKHYDSMMETLSQVSDVVWTQSSQLFRTLSEKVLVITDEIAKILS